MLYCLIIFYCDFQCVDSHAVTQFQIHGWSNDGVVSNPSTLLQVIESVIKVQQRSGEGPVVVQCRYIYIYIIKAKKNIFQNNLKSTQVL